MTRLRRIPAEWLIMGCCAALCLGIGANMLLDASPADHDAVACHFALERNATFDDSTRTLGLTVAVGAPTCAVILADERADHDAVARRADSHSRQLSRETW